MMKMVNINGFTSTFYQLHSFSYTHRLVSCLESVLGKVIISPLLIMFQVIAKIVHRYKQSTTLSRNVFIHKSIHFIPSINLVLYNPPGCDSLYTRRW